MHKTSISLEDLIKINEIMGVSSPESAILLSEYTKSVLSETRFQNDMKKLSDLKTLEKAAEIEQNALTKAAAAVAVELKITTETFSLMAPESLTIYRSGKFSKEAHMGMEDFKPLSAYPGKRGQIILTFIPVMVSSYTHMEMPLEDAKKKLSGFKEFYDEKLVGCMAEIERGKLKVAIAQREVELVEKSETYKDIGFGSW